MLKFNQFINLFAIYFYNLNTSYVKVQYVACEDTLGTIIDLNTSYVKVQ